MNHQEKKEAIAKVMFLIETKEISMHPAHLQAVDIAALAHIDALTFIQTAPWEKLTNTLTNRLKTQIPKKGDILTREDIMEYTDEIGTKDIYDLIEASLSKEDMGKVHDLHFDAKQIAKIMTQKLIESMMKSLDTPQNDPDPYEEEDHAHYTSDLAGLPELPPNHPDNR